MGHLFKKNWTRKQRKKKKNETRPIPPLKRVQIRSSNKKDQRCSKSESISSLSPEHFTFHKIRILSSTNLLQTTIQLSNTGNQGMLHSLPETPHISLRVRRRWSKFPTMVRITHLGRLESTIGESLTTF